MTRNRDATRQRILDAAFSALMEGGFQSLGINEVARRADCDKKLIYRYFDGMDGLVAAMGDSVAGDLATALEATSDTPAASYLALVEELALALYAFLRTSPRYRLIRILEATTPGPLTDGFRKARGKAMQGWMMRRRGMLTPPADSDAPALNAVIVAAVEGLAVFGAVGLDPLDPATTGRIEAAISRMVRGA